MNGPRFEWISRQGKPEVFEISSAFVDIGRIPHYCDIAVLASTITKIHARIREVEGGHDIQDLGSVRGTYVNGKRVECQRLRSGDTFRIADAIEFEYREGSRPNDEIAVALPRSEYDVYRINDRRIIIGLYEGGDSKIVRFRLDQRSVEYDIMAILENYPRG